MAAVGTEHLISLSTDCVSLRLVEDRSRRDGDAGKKKGVLRVARYPAERPWSRTHNAVEVVPV